MQRPIALLAALSCAGLVNAAQAAEDPAATRVEGFCRGLAQAAKLGRASVQQKAGRLEPLVADDFNIPMMAQLAIGEPWSRMSANEREALTAALTRYTAARYAAELDDDTAARCTVDPRVDTRGPDKLVRTKVPDPDGPVSVNYRLRQDGGGWKVIDVYYNGVSELATQRADFAGVVRAQGAAGLVARLKELTAKMR